MIIAIGADHGGFLLKNKFFEFLKGLGHKVHDLVTHSEDPVDYPDFAVAIAREILLQKMEKLEKEF
jgi:ribose 5-phosphate isomerase RpiB